MRQSPLTGFAKILGLAMAGSFAATLAVPSAQGADELDPYFQAVNRVQVAQPQRQARDLWP